MSGLSDSLTKNILWHWARVTQFRSIADITLSKWWKLPLLVEKSRDILYRNSSLTCGILPESPWTQCDHKKIAEYTQMRETDKHLSAAYQNCQDDEKISTVWELVKVRECKETWPLNILLFLDHGTENEY